METNPTERMYLQTENLVAEIQSRNKPSVPTSGMMAPRKNRKMQSEKDKMEDQPMYKVARVFEQLRNKRMEKYSA